MSLILREMTHINILEATVKKSLPLQWVTCNTWRIPEAENRHYIGSPMTEEMEVIRSSPGGICTGEILN